MYCAKLDSTLVFFLCKIASKHDEVGRLQREILKRQDEILNLQADQQTKRDEISDMDSVLRATSGIWESEHNSVERIIFVEQLGKFHVSNECLINWTC